MQRIPSANMMADINITPLVDVMLVLLVIFMLVTPAIQQTLTQPLASSKLSAEAKPHKLVVQAGDTYLLDGQAISLPDLKERFNFAIREDKHYAVQVFGEPDASYQSFTYALTTAKNAGVENVSLASN